MSVTAPSDSDRAALSGVLAGVSFIGGLVAANVLADIPYPRPGATPSQLRQYFTRNAAQIRINAAGQAISAASLARFTGSAARLAGRVGPGSQKLQAAAVAGGAVAAASLAASAACTAALSARWGRSDASAAIVSRNGFIAGGVIHSPAFRLLTGALGLAGLRTGELPRPLAITALASAAACLLAPLYFVAELFAWPSPPAGSPGWSSAASPVPGSPATGTSPAGSASAAHSRWDE